MADKEKDQETPEKELPVEDPPEEKDQEKPKSKKKDKDDDADKKKETVSKKFDPAKYIETEPVTEQEEQEELDEVLSIAQRRARGRTMKRFAKRNARKRKISMRKKASTEKLMARAEKHARNKFKDKLAGGKKYSELGLGQRAQVDKRLEKFKDRIKRTAKKELPAVRKAEMERVKKMRSSKKEGYDLNKVFESFLEENQRKMKDDPCWDGYEMIGKKMKNGKEVPNCVPKESLEENSVTKQKFNSLLKNGWKAVSDEKDIPDEKEVEWVWNKELGKFAWKMNEGKDLEESIIAAAASVAATHKRNNSKIDNPLFSAKKDGSAGDPNLLKLIKRLARKKNLKEAKTMDGDNLKVGDFAGFKDGVEQYGKVVKIQGNNVTLSIYDSETGDRHERGFDSRHLWKESLDESECETDNEKPRKKRFHRLLDNDCKPVIDRRFKIYRKSDNKNFDQFAEEVEELANMMEDYGAGFDGTDELAKNYYDDTPGQDYNDSNISSSYGDIEKGDVVSFSNHSMDYTDEIPVTRTGTVVGGTTSHLRIRCDDGKLYKVRHDHVEKIMESFDEPLFTLDEAFEFRFLDESQLLDKAVAAVHKHVLQGKDFYDVLDQLVKATGISIGAKEIMNAYVKKHGNPTDSKKVSSGREIALRKKYLKV